jgi:C_GCAxxG_C_C family probable redox protein
MKLDEKILEEKIREYRKTKSCSESTLMALCETAEASISKEEMLRLACGYSGGIGGTFDEGTCGALNGALIADGILLEDQGKIKANAKILFNSFKEEYGSVCCGTITNNGEDKSPCVDCCVFIAQKLAELLDE